MPVYEMELTDGRIIELEASNEKQAVEAAEIFEKGGEKALEARYGDMSYPEAAATRAVAGATASLSAPVAAGMDYLADNTLGRLFGNHEGRSYREYLEASRGKLDNARDNAGVGWEIAGGVGGAFIPGANLTRLGRAGTGMANMAGRTGLGIAEGAAYGGIQAASEGDNVLENAITGGAMGLGGSLAGQALRKTLSPAQNKLVGRTKRQVDTLTKEGVSVPASTQTGSNILGNLERQATRLMFSGGQDVVGKSYDDFTRAVASKLDDSARTADEIGPRFWDRIGDKFDEGYAKLRRNGRVKVEGTVSDQLDDIVADAGFLNLTDAQLRNLTKEVENIQRYRTLNGRAYQETHQRLSKLIRQQQGGSDMRGALISVQSALADGFRASDAKLADEAAKMRRSYRMYKQIEPAVDPRTGKIDPHKFYNSVKKSEGTRRYLRGKGDLTPLSEAGSALIRQPGTSNTAENLINAGMLGLPATAAVAGNPALAGALAAGAGSRIAADAYLTSPIGQRHLKADWLSGSGARSAFDRAGQAAARGGINTLTPEQRRLMDILGR